METLTKKKRNRKPHSEETKRKMRASMLRNGHRPPSQKGVARSLETRKKISEAKIGHNHSDEVRLRMSIDRKGEGNHFYGKTHKESSLQKMSLAKIGKKPSNWISDRTKVKLDTERGGPRHKEWSKAVKNRDHWKCQVSDPYCQGKIVAHHIQSWSKYPDLRYQINNGIALCHFHHPRKRADEIKLSSYFQSIVGSK